MITVPTHVRKRFRERFRLQFHPDIFKDSRDVTMLRKLFGESKAVDFALMQRIGSYNALCCKHGRKVRISKTRNVVFVHSEDRKVLFTVLQEGSFIANMKF